MPKDRREKNKFCMGENSKKSLCLIPRPFRSSAKQVLIGTYNGKKITPTVVNVLFFPFHRCVCYWTYSAGHES